LVTPPLWRLRDQQSMFEEIGGEEEKLSAHDNELTNRLGFMDLAAFCKKHNYCYYLSWYAGYENELTCQPNLGGQAWGEYGEKLRATRIKFSGKPESISGLAGRTFDAKDAVLSRSVTEVAQNATEAEKTAAELAKECGVQSAWAIWRDGAVYEFGSLTPLEELPHSVIATIGGSLGLTAAIKAVMAAAKMKKLLKKKS